jgi:hypothetical protein
MDQDFIEDTNFDMPYFMRGMMVGRNIQVSIEFSDYSVSQTLAATIDGWIESLPKQNRGVFANALFRLEKPVTQFADTFVRSVTLFAGAVSALSSETWQEAAFVVLATMSVAFFLFSLVDYLVGKFYEGLTGIRPLTYILVTEGDRDRQRGGLAARGRAKAVLSFVTLGVVLSVVVGIFSNFLYDALKDVLIG